MPDLIEKYEIQMAEPGCSVGTGRWGVLVTLPNDISAVFPYLNAVLPKASYDHENQTITWTEPEQAYALRPTEMRISRVTDPAQGRAAVAELVARINRIWNERGTITPSTKQRKPPPVMEIFKLLPRTNCRQCGYATCMAFAAALSQGAAKLEQCPPLMPEAQEKLRILLASN
ncbi:MAG: (Fe-S)-binding protein [Dehalococcoidales bacterium]|nr:(Fe-S)-binding protein [Dehalococcoidales bacterium]